jgi:tetratricopeptide (TPR) repeat protein
MRRMANHRAVHISEITPVSILRDTVQWRPVRRTLGVQAFGINAYSGEKAGDQVVEEHDELGGGAGRHEELYVVLEGRATFTVDGEEIDAPAGTLVFLPDPASKRVGYAAEDETTVLVIGSPVGRAYGVSPWEYFFEAQPAYDAGDYDRAYEIAARGLEHHPENPSLNYNLACYRALSGHADEALDLLERGFELNPEMREWAASDTDFDALRGDPRFERLMRPA